MKSLATWFLIGACILNLMAPAPAEAAERKSRRERGKTGTSTNAAPATAPLPSIAPSPASTLKPVASSELKVVRPQLGEDLTISKGSTFVIGKLPDDQFTLRCNGKLCDVYADGAFVGYVPLRRVNPPMVINQKSLDAVFEFIAVKEQTRLSNVVFCATSESPTARKVAIEKLPKPRVMEATEDRWVGMENDTETGGKPLINLGKVVYFPKGSRIAVKEKKGEMYLTEQLIEGGALWIPGTDFKETQESVTSPEMSTEFQSDKKGSATVYRFQTPGPVPLIFEETSDRSTLKLRFLSNTPRAFVFPQPMPIWGFDALYEDGETGHTTVTVNFAPPINKEKPFSGLKIVVDPGHHPDPGALGPRGTEERAITLPLARQLADELRARGAEVTLSREDQPLELSQRQARFRSLKPDMVISIHLNSVGDEEDPRLRWGTQNIFLYPHSQPLAKSIHRYLTPVVRGHDLSFVQRNLVVTRYPAVPVVLVESTHIIMPDEEKKLLTPEYRAELSKAIAEGISNFLLGEAEAKR